MLAERERIVAYLHTLAKEMFETKDYEEETCGHAILHAADLIEQGRHNG